MKASCVVLTHQRHGNLEKIIDSLLATPEITEVCVWNNDCQRNDELLTTLVGKYRSDPVHLSVDADKRNLYTWGRWKAAKAAQCGIVCTQDDDVLVSPEKWKALFDKFESDNCRRMACYLDESHYKHGIERRKYMHSYLHGGAGQRRVVWEALVGWGAVFQRDWVTDVFAEYFALQPADDLSYRKADRVFGVMLEQEHSVLKCDVEHLDGANSEDAVYRRKDHWTANVQAIERAMWVLEKRP